MTPFAASWLLDQRVAYLDHGAFGACPQPVVIEDADIAGLQHQVHECPLSVSLSRNTTASSSDHSRSTSRRTSSSAQFSTPLLPMSQSVVK